MRLKVFKLAVLAAALIFFLSEQEAHAAKSVYCVNCGIEVGIPITSAVTAVGGAVAAVGSLISIQTIQDEAIGSSIVTKLDTQTEALMRGMEFSVKAKSKFDLEREKAGFKAQRVIANAEAHDPALSKPDTACVTYESAFSRSTASQVTKDQEIIKVAKETIEGHNKAASKLSETEPKRQYFVKQILDRLDSEDEPVGSFQAFTAGPFEADELPKRMEQIAFLTNPFPHDIPSEEAMEAIKESGSTGDQEAMARMLVSHDRLELSQGILTEDAVMNAQLVEGKSLEKFTQRVSKTLSDEQKELLSGKLSPYQVDELMATYRVKSPEWVASIVDMKMIGVAREQAIMQAEILNQLWLMNESLRKTLKLKAFIDAREINQKGVLDK